MAQEYTTAGKNKMLDALGVTHVAAFNGDPEGAGSQVGSRASITWAAAAAGAIDSSNQPAISITGGNSVDYLAFYDAATAGTLLAKKAIATETFGADGTLTVTDADLDLSLDPA